MNEVKIRTSELLSTLRSNRAAHVAAFEKAEKGYRDAAVQALNAQLELALTGKKFELYINLPKPENHAGDYDRVIKMLEMSVESEVTLQSHEFDQLVMDNWAWAKATRMINASYVK